MIKWAAPAITIMSISCPAGAQQLALAEELFNKGLADMEAGHYDTGCPAIAESLRLDPLPGTLFTLAECEAKLGKVATAVARYEDYLKFFARLSPEQQQRQFGREAVAAAKKAELRPRVPLLTIVVKPPVPAGTEIMLDDVELAQPSLGIPLPVDPGEHILTTQAPGGAVTKSRVTLSLDEKRTVELMVELPAPKSETASTPAPPDPAPEGGTSMWRVAAYTTGGVGLAAIAVGAVTGALVFSEKTVIEANCIDTACNKTGKDAADRGAALGLASTIGFGIGAAALGTGAALLVLQPRRASSPPGGSPQLSGSLSGLPGGARLSIHGVW
ncbi:hypothetical protein WMF38_43485 [Sorangium sp. So ce118]